MQRVVFIYLIIMFWSRALYIYIYIRLHYAVSRVALWRLTFLNTGGMCNRVCWSVCGQWPMTSAAIPQYTLLASELSSLATVYVAGLQSMEWWVRVPSGLKNIRPTVTDTFTCRFSRWFSFISPLMGARISQALIWTIRSGHSVHFYVGPSLRNVLFTQSLL